MFLSSKLTKLNYILRSNWSVNPIGSRAFYCSNSRYCHQYVTAGDDMIGLPKTNYSVSLFSRNYLVGTCPVCGQVYFAILRNFSIKLEEFNKLIIQIWYLKIFVILFSLSFFIIFFIILYQLAYTYQVVYYATWKGSLKTMSWIVVSLDPCQYLSNCALTPPLARQQSTDNKLGLMLG